MDIFVIANCFIYLFLMVNLQWISEKYLGDPSYFEGIGIIPVVMLGALFLGIYLNLSIWYKLSDQTRVGLYISLIGAAITIGVNYFFIPKYGYWASAFGALATFTTMMVISYLWGRKSYPIPYNTGKVLLYLSVAILFSMISFFYFRLNYIVGNFLLVAFGLLVVYKENAIVNKLLKR